MAGPLPLLALSLAFVTGIWLGSWVGGNAWLWSGLTGGSLVYCLAASGLRTAFPSPFVEKLSLPAQRLAALSLAPLILLAAMCAGAARYQFAHPAFTPADLAWYNDQGSAVLEGVIVSLPEQRDTYTLLRVRVTARAVIDAGGEAGPSRPVRGFLVARAPLGDTWHYGDTVRLRGSPVTPPENEDFSYREYLAVRQNVYTYLPYAQVRMVEAGQGAWLPQMVNRLRVKALALVREIYPAPESELLAGILLGDDSGLPRSIQEDFQQTGTAHIIAISGFNIGILAALFTRQFSRLLGPLRGALAALLVITFYVALVGGGASVIRAAIMGGLGILGSLAGRRQVGLNTLAVTSAVMCLIRPDWLWDTSFQLSFFATLGLVLYAQPMEGRFLSLAKRFLPETAAVRLAGPVGEYFLFTLAAQLATLPLIAATFGKVSWTSLLVNPLVLPVQPAVIQAGGISVLLGLIHPNLGRLAGWLAWPFAAYTLRLVEAFGSIPNPAWEFGRISPWIAAAAYALLFGLTFLRGRLAGWTRILRPSLGVGALGALTLLAWQAALAGPDGRLHLTLLDTGAAQSMLIQTPGGGQILINGGESATALQTVLDRRRPVLTSCELDLLVVAPKRSADLLGLPDLAGRCPPAWALWAGPMQNTRTAQRLVERLMEQDVPIIPAEAGQSVTLGGSGELRVLSAGKEGILLLLEYGNFRAWLPFGDPPGEEVPGPVTAMLGGSRIEDLGSLYPDLILVSGTVDDPQVLETFQGYNLFTTARNGWIEIETDGDSLWVEVENK